MNIIIIGATSGIGKALFEQQATAISLPLRRQEDCVVNRWHLPTARRRPIKSTIWKPCAKRLSKLAEKSSSQIYAPALSIQQWQMCSTYRNSNSLREERWCGEVFPNTFRPDNRDGGNGQRSWQDDSLKNSRISVKRNCANKKRKQLSNKLSLPYLVRWLAIFFFFKKFDYSNLKLYLCNNRTHHTSRRKTSEPGRDVSFKKEYTKQPITLAEQIDMLKQRGLIYPSLRWYRL